MSAKSKSVVLCTLRKHIQFGLLVLLTYASTCLPAASSTYWNLFNAEGESAATAVYVTYATLGDMLNDTNRTGTSFPTAGGAGVNVVGSGAFVDRIAATPLPSALPLFAGGAGLLGLLGWRRKKQKAFASI